MNTTLLAGSLIAGLSFVGCSSTDTYSNNHASSTTFATVDQQIAHGAQVFTNNCAKCHGVSGQGTEHAPMLVGKGALSDFRTAKDVAEFAIENMPPKLYYFNVPHEERGSRSHAQPLPDSDYWAVISFALTANGIKLDEPVGPRNARNIVLNP